MLLLGQEPYAPRGEFRDAALFLRGVVSGQPALREEALDCLILFRNFLQHRAWWCHGCL